MDSAANASLRDGSVPSTLWLCGVVLNSIHYPAPGSYAHTKMDLKVNVYLCTSIWVDRAMHIK